MKHSLRTLMLMSGALSLTIGAVADVAADANEEGQVALVCYKWDAFPNERLRVSIRKPAPLTETVPEQVVWGLTGKHVGACGEGTAPVVRGNITADEMEGTTHMGIYSIAVRGDGDTETCRTVNWSCSAPSPVRAPETWSCESRNEFDVYHGASTLTKITDPAGDPLCGVFEAALSSPEGAVASGTSF
ncbi:MAG: hypothetical protein U9Q81_19640 [Pseudomonadota bacterium]|nr:hypothetical protein [Pseudomonadota bacterium]